MRLNYVSVTKECDFKIKEERYVIRGEMDCIPPILWFKQLQLLWICSPKLRKLCIEPQLNKNEIIISLHNQEDILETIDVLKKLIDKVNISYIMQDSQVFSFNFKESFL